MSNNKKLSVIMPAFNESRSVEQVINDVLNLDLQGVLIELIIVESASTDGTREVVEKYIDNPKVKVLLQDTPRGKGNAVRAGLSLADGDFILIQDADLEYEVSDYPALLEPLLNQKTNFVLGTRHKKGQPMRSFGRKGVRSTILNIAHKAFTFLFNVVYRSRLTDPFTMYKVFTRESIQNIHFQSNRFDFDWELVAKLLRTGCVPIEVPVTYKSRGFEEGKKVRFFMDPISWIVALVRFRFQRI